MLNMMRLKIELVVGDVSKYLATLYTFLRDKIISFDNKLIKNDIIT